LLAISQAPSPRSKPRSTRANTGSRCDVAPLAIVITKPSSRSSRKSIAAGPCTNFERAKSSDNPDALVGRCTAASTVCGKQNVPPCQGGTRQAFYARGDKCQPLAPRRQGRQTCGVAERAHGRA